LRFGQRLGLERVSLGAQRVWYRSCVDEFTRRLVPDGLWEITEPLIPATPKRAQGGGIQRVDDRQVFAAIVFVLTAGCAWRHLPPTFGVSHQTAHRRFTEWSEAALWAKLHRAVLDRLGAQGEVDWSRAIVDAASMRAKRGDR
jgi:transposase